MTLLPQQYRAKFNSVVPSNNLTSMPVPLNSLSSSCNVPRQQQQTMERNDSVLDQSTQIKDHVTNFSITTKNNKKLNVSYTWFEQYGSRVVIYLQCRAGTRLNLLNLVSGNFNKFQRVDIVHPNEKYDIVLNAVLSKLEDSCAPTKEELIITTEVYRLMAD